MHGAGLIFFRVYKKEILSLAYLFFVGSAFGAIWIFYDNHGKHDNHGTLAGTAGKDLAFEENHQIVEMVIAETANPVAAGDIREEAWQTYAVRVEAIVQNHPQISIVIDDLGVVKGRTHEVIKLDAPLTLSFLPYAPDLQNITQFARVSGHELMVHLPMEPKGNKDPGPHALLTGVADEKILQDLAFNLSQFDGYVGINNHMGSAFTEYSRGLDLILDEVQNRGLLVLDSRTSQYSLLAKMATERDIPNLTRDVFLDNEQDVDYILGQLDKLEKMALRRGSAIAIGHPYGETIEALSRWLPTLKQKGIVVVPLSHLIKSKYHKIQVAQERRQSGGQASSVH
ncbi:MAG: hypothetical protein COB54_06685 [Alphaproteobacteria bacterium]|nr:MAG: hypothetical protein COB54_06685 [Alphaproteobacteria bacterium]